MASIPLAVLSGAYSANWEDLFRLYVEDEDSDIPWSLENVPALEDQIRDFKPALVIIDSLIYTSPASMI